MSAALAQTIATARGRAEDRTPIIGISGAQGAGKSTLVREYIERTGQKIASFSLDDAYTSRDVRRTAAKAHRNLMFATRGVPGTHDLNLLDATLDALLAAGSDTQTRLPVFDKVRDDPLPTTRWPAYEGRPDIIILDGWCLGATPQAEADLAKPINKLETAEDPKAEWRRATNAALAGPYQQLFARLDAILFLKAPSFDVVLDWRCQQEEGLLGHKLSDRERAGVQLFISHFERITLHMLDGGRRADVVAKLDADRRVTAIHGA
jgi:D-glycerate 3-kinase